MLDFLIQNGTIVDGLGSVPRIGDVGVQDGKIVAVEASLALEARRVIDATGLVVCPGFVDVHAHDDLALLHDPPMMTKLMQGVTTTIVGNCGLAPTPVSDKREGRAALRQYIEPVLGAWEASDAEYGFPAFADYANAIESTQHGIHVAALVAHGPLRIRVMGFSDAPATDVQMTEMEKLLEAGMVSGALGLSLGLMYAPGCFATMDELIRLGRVVQRNGGVVTAHIRGEGDLLLSSVQEMINLSRLAQVPVHISHLKAVGIRNWGTIGRALNLIDSARESGLDITCDAYPYAAGSTTILSLLPPWVMEGGVDSALARIAHPATRKRILADLAAPGSGWDNVAYLTGFDRIYLTASHAPDIQSLVGLSFRAMAEQFGTGDIETYLSIVERACGDGTIVIHHMDENDVRQVLRYSQTIVGSDGLPLPDGHPHPRLYGTFARYLGQYVRDEGILQLEEAVERVTSASVRRFHLGSRGRIEAGCIADIVLLDYPAVEDLATYEDSKRYPKGIRYVLVQGELAVSEGKWTGALFGQYVPRQ